MHTQTTNQYGDRRDGRVPLEDMQPKVEMVIREDAVMSKSGKAVKMNLEGREFSCCIHSDLPREFFSSSSIYSLWFSLVFIVPLSTD